MESNSGEYDGIFFGMLSNTVYRVHSAIDDMNEIRKQMSLSEDSPISDISCMYEDTAAVTQKQHEDFQMPSSVSCGVYEIVRLETLDDESFQGKNMRYADLGTIDEYDEIDVCEQGKVMANLDVGQFASKEQQQSSGCVGEDEHLALGKLLQNCKLDDVKKQTSKSQSADKFKANVPSLNLASVPNELVRESSFVRQNMRKSGGTKQQETVIHERPFVSSRIRRKTSVRRKLFPEDGDVVHSEGQGQGEALPSKYPRSCPDISPVPDKNVSHSAAQSFSRILPAKAVYPQLKKPHVLAQPIEATYPRVTTPSKSQWDAVTPVAKACNQSPPKSNMRSGLDSPLTPFVPSHIVPSEAVHPHNEASVLELPEGKKSSPEGMERSDLTCSYSRSNTIWGQKK